MPKSIVLDPEQASFVEGLVATGRYGSADDVLLEGLRLLQAREARLTELRAAWRGGVQSGGYEPLGSFLDEVAGFYASRADAGA